MKVTISKTQLKQKSLKLLKKRKKILKYLRGTVIEYKDPTEPIWEDWEA